MSPDGARNQEWLCRRGPAALYWTGLEEKHAYQWTPEVEATFHSLKGDLCTAPIHACLQPGERLIIDSGASNVGSGEVLSQVRDVQEQITTYYTKTLNKEGKN
jgi:hypothetical protein